MNDQRPTTRRLITLAACAVGLLLLMTALLMACDESPQDNGENAGNGGTGADNGGSCDNVVDLGSCSEEGKSCSYDGCPAEACSPDNCHLFPCGGQSCTCSGGTWDCLIFDDFGCDCSGGGGGGGGAGGGGHGGTSGGSGGGGGAGGG